MRRIGRVVVALLLAAGLGAWATTDRYGASRAIVWLGADTGDIDRFPAREVPAGSDVVDLPAGPALDLSTVLPDPDPEAFLTRTGTAAFLVVQDERIRDEGYFNRAQPARDDARFGLLFANGGRIGDEQVVDAAWLRQATSADAAGGAADFYAFHWWTGRSDGEPFPAGHFMAAGNFGQFVDVAPDRDVVLVRLGDDDGVEGWPALLAGIAEQL